MLDMICKAVTKLYLIICQKHLDLIHYLEKKTKRNS